MTVQNYNRVAVTDDIRHAAGHLMVGKGAIGAITARHEGFVWIEFDAGQRAYVRPDGGGRRHQRVPFIATRVVTPA